MLSFNKHIKSLCRKACQKLNAQAQISNYLAQTKKNEFFNLIIKYQFSYSSLIWIFCSSSLNNLVNRIHERGLRLINNDHVSFFQDILEMTMKKKIHQNNLKSYAKEIYKFLNGLPPPIMHAAFMIRNNKYNLRKFQFLHSTNKRTAKYRTENFTYRGPQIWNLVRQNLKIRLLFEFLKRKLENGRVKIVHAEFVKLIFNK